MEDHWSVAFTDPSALARIHEAAHEAQRRIDHEQWRERQLRAYRKGLVPLRPAPIYDPEPLERQILEALEETQQETKPMTAHNDTLTALHVKQGTKFCSVSHVKPTALGDAKATASVRKPRASDGDTFTYKHAMDLEVGALVLTSNGPAVVTALDAAPQFGRGIEYKWIIADVTADVEALHEMQERETKAVEAMAVNEAMSAADKVLMEAGITDTSGVAGLLDGPDNTAALSTPGHYAHDGGGMPSQLSDSTQVNYRLRDGSINGPRSAGSLTWSHTSGSCDIVEWWYA